MAQPQQQPQQPQQAQQQAQQQAPETKLLWNPENVKDVAESVGISVLNDDALRVLTQDVEYRIGQVTVEALRFMRAARRTTLAVGDVSQALKVLDVEPLYGYDSTRPLRYGEASLGPGQPLFYIEDEEVDFEKLINAPLPKVPRDMSFTGTFIPRSRDSATLPPRAGANQKALRLAASQEFHQKCLWRCRRGWCRIRDPVRSPIDKPVRAGLVVGSMTWGRAAVEAAVEDPVESVRNPCIVRWLTSRDPAHWLAIEGVQPSIPQNPTTAESRSQELLPKGPGANPAMAALAGNDNISFRPTVKHIISKELVLYFEKVQTALLDDNPDEEVVRLRQAALASVRSDPGLHQLIPYFVNFVSNQVTHRLDDTFVLRRVMELTEALIGNANLFLDPYANSIAAPVLTCLLGRKLGSDDTRNEQYELREFSASLLGKLATRYAASNHLLRPKLVRTCLKFFLDPDRPPATHFGAITGLAAAGGPEAVRVLVLKCLRTYSDEILQRLRDKGGDNLEFEMLAGGIVKAILTLAGEERDAMNGVNGAVADGKTAELVEFLGPILGERIKRIGNHKLVDEILDARNIQ